MKHDRKSLLIVIVVFAASLGAGAVLAGSQVTAVESISARGVTVDIPRGWITGEQAGDTLIRAWSPTEPDARISVQDVRGMSSESAIAVARAAEWVRQEPTYRVLDERVPTDGEAGAYRVDYAYVTEGGDRVPRVVRGVDLYYGVGAGRLIIITAEAPSDDIDGLETRLRDLNARTEG